MAVTMKDIARNCGLSSGSVSQVIRNPDNPRFSPATRKLILETAARLDYHQNSLSCALRTSKTRLIGLMLPWNEPEVMDNIERIVSENGYKLLIQFTAHPRPGMEQAALQSFLSWNVEGIIWEPSSLENASCLPLLERIHKEKRPLILLERGVNGMDFPLVRTDYTPALNVAVSHLKDQHYRKVVFAVSKSSARIMKTQCEVVRGACRRMGLAFHTCQLDVASPDLSGQIRHLLSGEKKGDTAYICFSWLALNFIEEMEALGLSAPDDLGLVLYSDLLLGGRYRFSEIVRPKLTVVRSVCSILAESAIRFLLSEIRHDDPRGFPESTHYAELFINQSTKRN